MKKKKFALSLILAIIVTVALTALPVSSNLGSENKSNAASNEDNEITEDEIKEKFASMSYPFVENRGVYNETAKYYTFIKTGSFFVTEESLVYTIADGDNSTYFEEVFIDSKWNNVALAPSGEESSETIFNHYFGNDESKWGENLPTYKNVNLGELYPNIDVKLKVENKNIEKLFYVNEGGNPESITVKVNEVESLELEEGKLMLNNKYGAIAMTAPVAYQEIGNEKKNVEVNYVIRGDKTYGFELGDYDKSKTLIIDPLIHGTYIGGSLDDSAKGIVVDSTSNKTVAGKTKSTDGPWSGVIQGVDNAVGVKFTPDMESIYAFGVFGGSGGNSSFEDVDATPNGGGDNLVFTGASESSSYPTGGGAYDNQFNGVTDAVVTKTDPSMSLDASTYIGGDQEDYANDITFDSSGDIIITGSTQLGFGDFADAFPATTGAYQGDEESDAWDRSAFTHSPFVSKFSGDLTTLDASTWAGGYDPDFGYGVDFDNSGNVYVTGKTSSSFMFETTPGAYQTTLGGFDDAFVRVFNSDLSSLLYSTYLGGSSADIGKNIGVDDANFRVYVSGDTQSNDFPMGVNVGYDDSHNGGSDAFVSILNVPLQVLTVSTYYGGTGDDYVGGMTINTVADNSIYIGGNTTSPNLPMVTFSYEEYYTGARDGYIAKFNQVLNSLESATYFGGNDDDEIYGLGIDTIGNVFFAGSMKSDGLPTASYDDTLNGGSDMFAGALDGDLSKNGSGNGGGAVPEYTTPIAIALAVGVSILVIVLVRQRMVKKQLVNSEEKEKK